MFDIRFYYKNIDDKHCKKKVLYHSYKTFISYNEAYEEFKWLIDLYKDIGINNVIFSPSFPEKILESYVLFLSEKGNDFATIVRL